MIETRTDPTLPEGSLYLCFKRHNGDFLLRSRTGKDFEAEVERIIELVPDVEIIGRTPVFFYVTIDGTWHYPDQGRRMEKMKKLIAKPDPGRMVATN